MLDAIPYTVQYYALVKVSCMRIIAPFRSSDEAWTWFATNRDKEQLGSTKEWSIVETENPF